MLQSILGIFVFMGLAYIFSENKKAISMKLILVGILLQFVLAFLLLKIPAFQQIFLFINKFVLFLEQATTAGSSFIFGFLGGGPLPYIESTPGASLVIAFKILPIVIVMSAFSAVLLHWGVLQSIVKWTAKGLQRSLSISGSQGLGVAANIFFGIVEAPLLIQPYLRSMSRSSLFVVMTAGMATVAGTVMILYATILNDILPNALTHILIASLISAPAAIVIGQILIPNPINNDEDQHIDMTDSSTSSMEALVKGTMSGMQLFFSIIGMIIVVFAVVSLFDQCLALLPSWHNQPLSLEYLISFAFKPIVWLIGIPWSEVDIASQLMSTKIVLNEFVSYQRMSTLTPEVLSEKSILLMTYAMCGFANFASLGLIVGSIGTLVPERRAEVSHLALKSVFAGILATCMTGAIVNCII